MFNLKDEKDLESPFDLIQFPSLGIFYKDHRASLLVKYMSFKEENILTSPVLNMIGNDGLDMVLNSVIMEKDVNVDELLIGDRNTILLYLRSTGLGDKYEVIINCPECNQSGKTGFQISAMQAKDIIAMPDEDGNFEFTMPKMLIDHNPVIVKFKALTVADEKKIEFDIALSKRMSKKNLSKDISIRYRHQITSINGIADKDEISKLVSEFSLRDSTALRKYIKRAEPGIDSRVTLRCANCLHSFVEEFEINKSFLGITPEHKDNLWEESFLLWYHSQGGINKEDAMKMATSERRWAIQRIIEELDKKHKAEEEAANKAKK